MLYEHSQRVCKSAELKPDSSRGRSKDAEAVQPARHRNWGICPIARRPHREYRTCTRTSRCAPPSNLAEGPCCSTRNSVAVAACALKCWAQTQAWAAAAGLPVSLCSMEGLSSFFDQADRNCGQSGTTGRGSDCSGSSDQSARWCQHRSCPMLSRCSRMPRRSFLASATSCSRDIESRSESMLPPFMTRKSNLTSDAPSRANARTHKPRAALSA